MIVYGIKFDEFDNERDDRIENMLPENPDELDFYDGEDGPVEFITCYSVSAYQPEASVLGVVLDRSSSIFYPLDITKLNLTPSDEQIAKLKKVLDELDMSEEPRVYVFENTDD